MEMPIPKKLSSRLLLRTSRVTPFGAGAETFDRNFWQLLQLIYARAGLRVVDHRFTHVVVEFASVGDAVLYKLRSRSDDCISADTTRWHRR